MKHLFLFEEMNMDEWLPADFDFRDYAEKNLPYLAKKILTNRDIDHIGNLLEMLAKAYSGVNPHDDFIEYLMKEKYDKALMNADDVNRIAFWVYVLFQINKVPLVMREKYRLQK